MQNSFKLLLIERRQKSFNIFLRNFPIDKFLLTIIKDESLQLVARDVSIKIWFNLFL